MRFAPSILAITFLCGCSFFAQDEARKCSEAAAYAGPPIHVPIDSASFLLPPAGFGGAFGSGVMAKLDSALQWIMDTTHATGVSASVAVRGKGIWSGHSGSASVEPGRSVDSNTVFHIASVGKMFTAAAIMRMAERDSIGYGDPLSRWFPAFRHSGLITVDQLLVNTNGIPSFNEDSAFQKAGYAPPEKLLAIAQAKPEKFCPGGYWYYSNTGYVLLALILEQTAQRPFHEILATDIIAPMGLKRTSALAPNVIPPQVAAPVVNGRVNADFNQSMPFGAGNIVSTAEDMVQFLNGYLSGSMLEHSTVADAARRLFPMYEPGLYYGRGLMVMEFKDAQGNMNRWMGHSGGAQGEKAVVAYDVNRRAFVSVIFNCDVSAEAAALRLLTVLDAALQ